jgi:predicted permease
MGLTEVVVIIVAATVAAAALCWLAVGFAVRRVRKDKARRSESAGLGGV